MTIKVSKPSINLREKLNELDFDKVPFQKMPAGSVLQVVNVEVAGNSSSSTADTWHTTVATIAITPKVTNSKIIVFFTSGVGISAASGGSARVDIELFCEEDTESLYMAKYTGNEGMSSSGTARLQIAGSGVYISNSRIEKNFRVRIRKANGSSSEATGIYYNWYSGSLHTLIAMEVAQ